MLGALRIRVAVPVRISVLRGILTPRLHPAIEVVRTIILHVRFHTCQIGGGGHVAPVGAAVAEADAEGLAIEEQVRELGIIAVAGVDDHEADLDKIDRDDEAVARVLPADPFRVERAQGMVRPLAGSILQTNYNGEAAFRLGGVGHAVGDGPAPANQNVIFLALNIQLLAEANVLDLISLPSICM